MPAAQTVLVFLGVLSVLVLAHELGHFVVAKRAGIKVQEFGFGYPPRLIGVNVGETIYSINLLPLGGFVRMLGETGNGDLAVEAAHPRLLRLEVQARAGRRARRRQRDEPAAGPRAVQHRADDRRAGPLRGLQQGRGLRHPGRLPRAEAGLQAETSSSA